VEALVAFGACADWIAGAARGGGVAEDAICATDDPEVALSWLRPRLRAGDLVVVKASRGTRLERIADPLVEAN
jgi:UDP-N-acetylmuramoyl-tripeptide--D-alanyl-D-alanine ligase